jgi:hypothetical protein
LQYPLYIREDEIKLFHEARQKARSQGKSLAQLIKDLLKGYVTEAGLDTTLQLESLPQLNAELTFSKVLDLAKANRELFKSLYRFFEAKYYIFEEVRKQLNIPFSEIYPTAEPKDQN